MVSALFHRRVEIEPHQGEQILVAHFGQIDLAAGVAEEVLGHLSLRLDQLVDSFLDCATADEFVHQHIAFLPDPKGTVGRLVLDGRIPPAVEVNDVRRGSQVEAGAAGLL
jgi:hypothetical protein